MPSLSPALGRDVSAPEVSRDGPLPSLVGEDETPAHLATLADRARGYVAAASSANTRKAYATDPSSKHPAIITVLHAEAGERPDCCRIGSHCQNCQGEINSSPVVSKSLRFRIANWPPLIHAIAAIMQRPARGGRKWQPSSVRHLLDEAQRFGLIRHEHEHAEVRRFARPVRWERLPVLLDRVTGDQSVGHRILSKTPRMPGAWAASVSCSESR